jgi:hypothetical protein
LGDEKRSDTEKEPKSGFPQIRAMYVVIAIAVIIIAVIFIAKFGFGTDLLSPSSGEMAILKRPVIAGVTTAPPAGPSEDRLNRGATTTTTTLIPTTTLVTAATCGDTSNDPNNCGACGRACSVVSKDVRNADTFGCSEGKCTIKSCKAGYGDCAQQGTLDVNQDGCETDLNTGQSWMYYRFNVYVYQQGSTDNKIYLANPQNCGSCGNACNGGTEAYGICDNGACRNVCAGIWLDCDNSMTNGCEQRWDNNNCGLCGAKCPTGSVCNSGCCEKAQKNPTTLRMEMVHVADSTGGICSGKPWAQQI